MGREVSQPNAFNMKDLFIDVKLEACVNGTTFDFLGRKLFSTEFFREGVGFGITSIDIEINTSLQPLVTIVFKDLYGLTVFGGQSRSSDGSGQSNDYSVIFNWPPPKFLFSFKGYLGKPASWVLNLKRTTTSFNSSDGSYELKCEFVPNQWGFFADLPFLYLLAAKRLRKDRIGPGATESQIKNITSIFDLIKIGKQVEIKTVDTTREFDELVKKLGSLKSGLSRALVSTNIISEGEEMDGTVNNQPVKFFKKIVIPEISSLDSNINTKQKIESKLGSAKEVNTLNAYLLLSVEIDGKDGFSNGVSKDYAAFSNIFNAGGTDDAINIAQSNALSDISFNLKQVDDEIKRRVFSTSETKLEKITIGEIFSQLAKDAAFIMGSILDAGLNGYRGDKGRQDARDSVVEQGFLIGESFPLVLKKDGEEVPATKLNLEDSDSSEVDLGVDDHEMQFVKNFISAISEGIATELLDSNQSGGQDDAILKQRVNNMEISSPNPYKPYYTNIATNVIVRGGIVGYMTRSSDPNLPGKYRESFKVFGSDRSTVASIQELAERDMQNISETMINSLSDVDFLLLKRFSKFFTRFWTSDFEDIANIGGDKYASVSSDKSNILSHKIVISNNSDFKKDGVLSIDEYSAADLSQLESKGVEYATFGQIWSELTNQSILNEYSVVGGKIHGITDIEDMESRREDVGDVSSSSKSDIGGGDIMNAQNPLSTVSTSDFTATRIINNGIAYCWPKLASEEYYAILFKGEDHDRAVKANTAPTDSEFQSDRSEVDSNDWFGKTEFSGYVTLNSKLDNEGKELGRFGVLDKYKDAGLVIDFEKSSNPGPSFFGLPAKITRRTTNPLTSMVSEVPDLAAEASSTASFVWDKKIVDEESDNQQNNQDSREVEYTGKLGYTIAHSIGSSPLVFGLFEDTNEGRNQRAYIKKCAEIIYGKFKDIEEKRNQIIGEVLGKAGEKETSIYKEMHTLFHQWQTLSYKDMKDSSGSLVGNPDENKTGDNSFDVASELERRFGSNHRDIQHNDMICFSEEELAEGTTMTDDERSSMVQSADGKYCVSLSDPNQASSVPDGTFIYDYPMQRIAKPTEPIDVRDSIINIEPLYKPNGNTTVLNIIQQICTKNNFLFIPIPGNPGYLNVREIYSPSMEPASIEVRNFFHVLFTPTPESRTKTRNTNGTPLSDYTNKQETYDVNSFVIKYGHPDNQIVSNIQVGTDDNKVTAESIINLQRLVDNENHNKKVTTDCSMLPVLAGRSYKATIDMLGNSQCYPMQFFYLENSPLFGGLYQIMKVKHSIEPNNMTTSAEGMRMRFSPGSGYGSIQPITLKTFADLGKSEAPNAIGAGFDESDRKKIKDFKSNPLPDSGGNYTVSSGGGGTSACDGRMDFSDTEFVPGNNGGPVAMSVPTLSSEALNRYDTSLGKRALYSSGKLLGREQMYMIEGQPLKADVLSAFVAIKAAAIKDGVDLKCNSGYRDPDNHIILNGKKLSSSQMSLRKANVIDKSKVNDINYLRTESSSKFKPQTAKPGFSAHNSGLAVDFNCGGRDLNTKIRIDVYGWLVLNAYRYGFVRTVNDNGGKGEEWHFEYRPGKPMFYSCNRSEKLWYGLPESLCLPTERPAPRQTSNTPLSTSSIGSDDLSVILADFENSNVPTSIEQCPPIKNLISGPIVSARYVKGLGDRLIRGKQEFVDKLDAAFSGLFIDIGPGGDTTHKYKMGSIVPCGEGERNFTFQRKAHIQNLKNKELNKAGKEWAKYEGGNKDKGAGPGLGIRKTGEPDNIASPCSGYHVVGQAVDINQDAYYTFDYSGSGSPSYAKSLGNNKWRRTFKDDILSHGPLYKSLKDAGLDRVSNEWWHWSLGEGKHDINKKFGVEGSSPSDYDNFKRY